jgi:flavin-dependent dehydrogenase
MKTSVKNIKIYGAGISGLVAAINLARSGYDVEVFEKRGHIGGSPHWHPSVHQQTFELEKTSEYIGIDLTPCFQSVKKHIFYLYKRKIVLDTPVNSYVCEKGPRPSSIENNLYSQAVNVGVRFNFFEALDLIGVEHLNTETQRCIVATGLEPKPYRDLGIRHAVLMGFRSSQITEQKDIINSYIGDYTNGEFAYVASYRDLRFSLLFARRKVTRKNLADFQKHLLESDNITFDEWHSSSGYVPLEKNLVKDGIVLAGAISGMIDPFYLNGISSALISGRIAAMFFEDSERAFREFSYFTRNFQIKRYLKLVADALPLKTHSFPLVARLNNRLKWVGVI